MWSDRMSAASRSALVERLRKVLPAARVGARTEAVGLAWDGDAEEIAAALRNRTGFVWLDQPRTRLFADPLVRMEVRDGRARVQGPAGTVEFDARGLDLVEAALEAWGGAGGAVLCGYLGYELGMELEDLATPRRRDGDLPDLWLGLYDWRVESDGDGWRWIGTDAWRRVRAEEVEGRDDFAGDKIRNGRTVAGATVATATGGFCEAVARTVERIRDGELFQVNLCRRLETELAEAEIWPLYERLRTISPASQGALLRLDKGRAVLSASPELFLKVEGRQVRSCPIKGTRPRGRSAEEDARFVRELRESEKDRAELAMIVDVTRNDLGRVCRAGSVKVERHAELMTLPTVHHTYSEVSGELREDCAAVDLLRASFPPASITGAPKIRAMEVAAEEEGFRRGAAMGAIGWISMGGEMELSVAIRTATASAGRVWYLAGCGITAESVPQEELQESEAKAAAFRRALGEAEARVAR